MDRGPIPETLLECFRVIEKEVSAKDIAAFKDIPEKKLHPLDHNMGWGLYLRNRFIHPHESPIRQKFQALVTMFEADEISALMRELFWMYLNGHKIDALIVKSMIENSLLMFSPIGKRKLDVTRVEDLLGK